MISLPPLPLRLLLLLRTLPLPLRCLDGLTLPAIAIVADALTASISSFMGLVRGTEGAADDEEDDGGGTAVEAAFDDKPRAILFQLRTLLVLLPVSLRSREGGGIETETTAAAPPSSLAADNVADEEVEDEKEEEEEVCRFAVNANDATPDVSPVDEKPKAEGLPADHAPPSITETSVDAAASPVEASAIATVADAAMFVLTSHGTAPAPTTFDSPTASLPVMGLSPQEEAVVAAIAWLAFPELQGAKVRFVS